MTLLYLLLKNFNLLLNLNLKIIVLNPNFNLFLVLKCLIEVIINHYFHLGPFVIESPIIDEITIAQITFLENLLNKL